MGKPIFGYWNLRGLGHSVRFALAHIGVDYEEQLFDNSNETGDAEWAKIKPTLGMIAPNLPYYIDDKEKLSESKAILKYVIRRYEPSLLPTDISLLAKTEEVEGILGDIDRFFAMSVYTDTEMANSMFESMVPAKLAALSKFLGTNKFFLGNEPSFVDFLAYETFYRFKTYRPKYVEGHKNILDYIDSFEKLPKVAEYIKSPAFIKAPCYGRNAVKQI